MLRCLIVDDDELSRKTLEQLVRQVDSLQLVQTCSGAVEAFALLQKEHIELIFLDIEMPEMTGIDLIRSLKHKPEIILVTGKEKYAIEAWEVEAADYLVKPIKPGRFLTAVNRILSRQSRPDRTPVVEADEDELFVKVESQLLKIPTGDILWVEADGDYVKLCTEKGEYITHSTLKGMERKLPAKTFMRIHRSYIIQLRKVKAIEETVIIIGKKVIPIGESYRSALMNRLNIV